MKISTKGKYGLKAYIYIAQFNTNRVTLSNISTELSLSENYLERLISTLRKGGYLSSTRGARGGYTISCDLNKTTVGDILRCLEGELVPVDCIIDKNASCGDGSCYKCTTKDIWVKIHEKTNEVVDNITIAQIIEGV